MPDVINIDWTAQSKQVEFLRIPDNVTEALYGGAAAGGKSEVLIMLPIVRQWHLNSEFKGILFRRTYPELDESLIPRCKKIYGESKANPGWFGATYHEQKHIFTFPSGAWIKLSYMNTDSDAEAHKSAEYNYIGFDELTTFTMYQYLYLVSRCRAKKGTNLPAIVRAGSNPEGIGLSWVRERFVEPAPHGRKLIQDKNSREFRIYIPARLEDNKYVDDGYKNKLELLPEATKKALKSGDWWAFAGQVFTEFRTSHYATEPENALHVIKPFAIPMWWPRIVAMDWGWRANTWVGWGAVSPDNRLYIYRELFCNNTYIATWAARAAALGMGENIRLAVLDPHAWDQRGEEHTIAEQVETQFGYPLDKADNDRIGGKSLIHEMLRWELKVQLRAYEGTFSNEKAQYLLTHMGKRAYNEYLALFEDEKPETNLPKLQIFDTCPRVIEAIQRCSYAKDATKQRLEDVIEYQGDDPYDGVRYLCKAYDKLTSESLGTFEEMQKTQVIIDQVKQDHDYTSFYMRMHELERRNKSEHHRGQRRLY
jgi:hypothetical protein